MQCHFGKMVVTIDIRHMYKFPLEFVTQTHFTKYPSDKEKFVKRIEVQEQKIDHQSGVRYRRSIAYCENVIPRILRTIQVLNEKAILLEEESWQNGRHVTIKSRNITWSKYANMWEHSTFKPCKDNPQWTEFVQHGCIDVKGIGPLGRVIEMFADSFLQSGVKRSLNIMEGLLQERYGEQHTAVSNTNKNSSPNKQSL